MASRYYDNSDQAQRFQPGTTARADEVDAKMDQVAAGFEGAEQDIDRSLKLPSSDASQELNASPLQRRRRVVGFDADGNLTLLAGFGWRGDLAASTEYFVNDVFRDPATKNLYVTLIRHTSAALLRTDIAAGRVDLAISVTEIEQLKTETQQIKDAAVSETTAIKNAAVAATNTATAKAREASTSAMQSATARNKAQQWANESEDAPVEPGQFSAKHHALKSAASANASSTSAEQSATARDKSQEWAEADENREVEAGQYSAKHHAAKSAASASSSYTSAGESAAARNDSQAARNKSQQWAEAEGEVEPGRRSAKHWAGKAAQSVADGVIDDQTTSLDKTWSSHEINTQLGNIGAILDEINGEVA